MESLDALKHLRNSPLMHLGQESASGEQLAALVIEDALHLGTDEVRVVRHAEGWFVVSAPDDWTRKGPGSDLSVNELFRRLIAFPTAGTNAVRHESYLAAYCRDVFMVRSTTVEVIAGDQPPVEVTSRLSGAECHMGFRI